MKVILLKNVKDLGKKNDIKDVSDGYARNFLFPKKLAVAARESEIKRIQAQKENEIIEAEKDLAKNQETVGKLEGLELEISAKAGAEGSLYAAISPAQISKALQGKGFDIKKNQIKINEAIKEIGESEIIIEFPHGLEAKIKVIVVEEK